MRRATPDDIPALRSFLTEADLTLAGLDSPAVRLWIDEDAAGSIASTTGFELAGPHALIRSVAVRPDLRGSGIGLRNAAFAIVEAQLAGASSAWLFSRRSGPFWQKLGFEQSTTAELAEALASTTQVRLFIQTGQLGNEIAWRKML